MMDCYICGVQTRTTDKNKTPLCFRCSPPINSGNSDNDFEEEEPTTAPLFEGIGEPIDLDEIESLRISDERWRLLEALFDEVRTVRENLYRHGQGYFVRDAELIEIFNILDTLEDL